MTEIMEEIDDVFGNPIRLERLTDDELFAALYLGTGQLSTQKLPFHSRDRLFKACGKTHYDSSITFLACNMHKPAIRIFVRVRMALDELFAHL